jgi:DNA (cytosine-5)-methyltransferase 1
LSDIYLLLTRGNLNFISLFSGAGGLDLGFEQAGFKPIIAYDNKIAAIKTYNHNRRSNIAKKVDLSQITGEEIILDIQNRNGFDHLNGVVGGPPCQYFSLGNRSRKEEDPRRKLPLTYAEILKELNEEFSLDFFIFENVFGLAKPSHKEDFETILSFLEEANFHLFYKILDANKFGVPQYRKRIFIIGWNKLRYPNADYKFPEGSHPGLTVGETIRGLKEPQYYKRNISPNNFPEHPNHWTMVPRSPKFNNLPHPQITNGARSFKRLFWDKPSYTVAYGHNEIHIHPDGHRRLSIYEAMLLQGFPKKNYELVGPLSEQVALISDAVPPPLAEALAISIVDFMENYSFND